MENISGEEDEGVLTSLTVGEDISDDIDLAMGVSGEDNKSLFVTSGSLSVLNVCSTDVTEPPTKKRRTRIDLRTKLEIVEKFESGQKSASLSKEYGISQRRIYDFCDAIKKIRASRKEIENESEAHKSLLEVEPAESPVPKLRPWVDNFAFHTSDYEGYITSHEMLLRLIQEFELDTKSTFIVKKSRRNYGKDLDLKHLPGKIRWQDTQDGARPQLRCDGIPFVIMGTRTLDCEYGPDREKKRRALRAEMHEKMKELPPHARKQRRRSKATKKLDCQAKVYVRHIIKFPQYEFADCMKDRRQREVMAFRMQHDFKRRDDIEIEHQFHVQLPVCHSNHAASEAISVVAPIDHHLAAFIHKAVIEDAVYSAREMKTLLRDYMLSSEELFKDKALPPRTNSRFWPTLTHIKNHMLLALMRHRDSCLDQSSLENMVGQWQQDWPNDYFFLRFKPDNDMELPSIETQEENVLLAMSPEIATQIVGDRQRFLFVHQTSWQRDLMRMYGNEVCILDAAYRYQRYPLPLYFVVIPTNVNFVIAASFIMETEDKLSVQEALDILCSWNPDWSPKYFLTDFSSEERGAVENTFYDYRTMVYYCDVQRLQSWERWLSSSVNRIFQFKESIMMILKDIADSETEDEYQGNLRVLEGSEVWQSNTLFRQWFQHKWLANKNKWVRAFREERFNAINTCTSKLKREGLTSLASENVETVSQLVYMMINMFLPDIYQWYLRENIKCSSEVQALGSAIPVFLKNRPMHFVMHVRKRWAEAQDLRDQIIKTVDNSIFHVSAGLPTRQDYFEVQLDNGMGSPYCQCKDWHTFHYPCKHILAVIASKNHPSMSWENLPESYRNNPFINLHLSLVVSTIKLEKEKPDSLTAMDGTVKDKNVMAQGVAKKIRSLAGEIGGLTYLCQDSSVLQAVASDLEKLKATLLQSCPSDIVHLLG